MLTTPVQPVSGTGTRRTRVSSSPSKIPCGGFSPVRLHTGMPPAPSSAGNGRGVKAASPDSPGGLYAVKGQAPGSCGPKGQACQNQRPSQSPPEALGSPADYAVPPSQGLLWPPPRLSLPPAALGVRPRIFPEREVPEFARQSVPSVPSSLSRQTGRLRWAVPSSSTLAFPFSVPGRRLQSHANRSRESSGKCPRRRRSGVPERGAWRTS